MLIAAALIELTLADSDSLKTKRRVVRAVKDRVSSRFRVSVAEVADHDDRHAICIGCAKVGVDPRKLRNEMEKVIRFVDNLGLAELTSDDVVVAQLDEFETVDAGEEA